MAILLSQMLLPACQLDNLVLINKIKEQLMTEKIRAQHLPPAAVPSQQPLLVQTDGGQHVMSIPKAQQMPGLHPHSPSPPDIALHARPASSSVSGAPAPPLPSILQPSMSLPRGSDLFL